MIQDNDYDAQLFCWIGCALTTGDLTKLTCCFQQPVLMKTVRTYRAKDMTQENWRRVREPQTDTVSWRESDKSNKTQMR